MKDLIRRLRGALGIGLKYGWITGPLGAVFGATSVEIARRGALREVTSRVDDGIT